MTCMRGQPFYIAAFMCDCLVTKLMLLFLATASVANKLVTTGPEIIALGSALALNYGYTETTVC